MTSWFLHYASNSGDLELVKFFVEKVAEAGFEISAVCRISTHSGAFFFHQFNIILFYISLFKNKNRNRLSKLFSNFSLPYNKLIFNQLDLKFLFS